MQPVVGPTQYAPVHCNCWTLTCLLYINSLLTLTSVKHTSCVVPKFPTQQVFNLSVTHVIGFVPANNQLPMPFHSWVRLSHGTDRRTDNGHQYIIIIKISPMGDWRSTSLSDLDLGSGHTAHRRASLIDLYLRTKFHWDRKKNFFESHHWGFVQVQSHVTQKLGQISKIRPDQI